MDRRKVLQNEENSTSNRDNSSLTLGTSSPDLTRMMTPTLSDDKTDTLSTDISLDFSCTEMSKFETDSMLNATFNPDRDIDRSPDTACLQLQSPSPLDLSITTSFENSLSDCGVSCFDSESGGKNAYSFSSNVNSTESDTFVNLDEGLTIDTLSKPDLSKVVPSTSIGVTHPPVILGSLGAANFVTAVLNKNINTSESEVPVINNMILPPTSLSLTTPGILVLNPCALSSGLVNLFPSNSNNSSVDLASNNRHHENTSASIIDMCPGPIKSILSFLTTKPQSTKASVFTASFDQNNTFISQEASPSTSILTSKCTENCTKLPDISEVCVLPLESEHLTIAEAECETDNKLENHETNLTVEKNSQYIDEDNGVSPAKKPMLIKTSVIDVSDIKDTELESDDDCADILNCNNICDEVDGNVVTADKANEVVSEASIKVNKMLTRQSNIQNESLEISDKQSTSKSESENISEEQINSKEVSESEIQNVAKKKRTRYNNSEKKPKKSINLKCDLCSATFSKTGNYHRHRKIHTIATEGEDCRFACSQCDRKFLQKCDLKRHMLIHMKKEPFRCEVCDKGYIRQSDLKVHIRFHTRERTHACDTCDKKFFQSGDLNRHKRRVHDESAGLVCGHCKRSYAKETTLIRHMQDNHRNLILKCLNDRVKT
ncbi:hypothetical protein SNE40_008050 [Patella caerulea]|uniref:C2H2-type domain-containing protein n=1 Tax=Patella caerulea TaxID=87958 RepID=A0AAN8K139_PATCE